MQVVYGHSKFEGRQLAQQDLQHDLEFGTGQGLAEAGVRSGAEDEVRVGAATEVHLRGVVITVVPPGTVRPPISVSSAR